MEGAAKMQFPLFSYAKYDVGSMICRKGYKMKDAGNGKAVKLPL